MMKEGRSFKCDKECDEHYRCDAKDHHCHRKKSDRKNHLTKMESRGSAYIEIKIGVMHVMESPEEGNHMVRPMPPPVGVIHQKKRSDASDQKRHAKPV